MDLGLISVRYARALFKASVEAKNSDKVYADMQVLAASYAEVPALKATIDNPMLSKSQKGDLLTSATGSTSCELTKRFIGLVLDEGRENIMQFIANSFITLYRKQNNLIKARLVTASQPSQQVEARLRQLVGSKTSGSKVEFVSEVDPDINGGFVLEYDTYRMDASIKTAPSCQNLSSLRNRRERGLLSLVSSRL